MSLKESNYLRNVLDTTISILPSNVKILLKPRLSIQDIENYLVIFDCLLDGIFPSMNTLVKIDEGLICYNIEGQYLLAYRQDCSEIEWYQPILEWVVRVFIDEASIQGMHEINQDITYYFYSPAIQAFKSMIEFLVKEGFFIFEAIVYRVTRYSYLVLKFPNEYTPIAQDYLVRDPTDDWSFIQDLAVLYFRRDENFKSGRFVLDV
jgi:hypothetical protein